MTQSALLDAGFAIEDIAGIAVGGVGRDILSTPSAAEHAFVLGALRVSPGQFRTQLVVGWSPTEVSSVPEALKLGTDPYYHRGLPLDELSSHAMSRAPWGMTPSSR